MTCHDPLTPFMIRSNLALALDMDLHFVILGPWGTLFLHGGLYLGWPSASRWSGLKDGFEMFSRLVSPRIL